MAAKGQRSGARRLAAGGSRHKPAEGDEALGRDPQLCSTNPACLGQRLFDLIRVSVPGRPKQGLSLIQVAAAERIVGLGEQLIPPALTSQSVPFLPSLSPSPHEKRVSGGVPRSEHFLGRFDEKTLRLRSQELGRERRPQDSGRGTASG
jgi:hypothetical protein